MKKLAALILTVAMLMSVIGVFPAMAEEEPVELDIFYDFSWLHDGYTNSDSRVFKAVEEATGVRMNVTRAKTSDGEQINLMLASGDLPDMVCVDYATAIYGALRESNAVMDLMPLMEEYAPELKERMGESYWNFYKSDAGINNYFANCAFSPDIADKYAAFGGWCEVMAVRQDIYEAMGSPSLSNAEELLDHLRAVREAYPDVKVYAAANAESLALTGRYSGLSWWKTAYGIETYYEEEDGTVVAAYNHPDYDEAIKLLNTMYLEGFITREDLASTDEANDAKKESGEIYMFGASPADIRYAPAGNPDVRYIASPVFDTWKGTQQGGIFWCATFITNNCEHPDAAIKLLDYLTSEEGDRLNQWGIEGEDWEYNENGVPTYTDWYYEQNATSSTEYNAQRGAVLMSMNWADHEWTNYNVPYEEEYMHQARTMMQDHYFCRLNFLSLDPTANSYESIVLQQCNDAWNAAIPEIIMAENNEAALAKLEELKATMESLDIASLEAYWTAQSNKIKEAFGEENMILTGADAEIFHETFG